MAPRGSSKPSNGNIFPVIALISVEHARNMHCMIKNDFVEFGRECSVKTRDIADFLDIASGNEIGITQNLQSESTK